MKGIIVLGLLFVLLYLASSCQNKEILLPVANETIAAETKEHSPVYFFFKTEEKDTLIDVKNSNAAIGNLVFNIDKRLPLRKVILEIKKMEVKKEISGNYFAYNDTVKKTVAFLPFKKSKYKLEKPDFNVVYFYLDRNDLVHFKDEVFSKNELKAFLDNESGKLNIFFAYDKGMSFGKYIQYKLFIRNLIISKKGIFLNQNKEYIY